MTYNNIELLDEPTAPENIEILITENNIILTGQ